MSIITKVSNFDEEWEKWIECECTKCNHTFEEDTEEFDLDEDEPKVECPNCHNKTPLVLIGAI